MPGVAEPAAVFMLLRARRASGSVVEVCVVFDRFWPRQSTSLLRPAGRTSSSRCRRRCRSAGAAGAVTRGGFGLKLLCDAHAFSSVPSTEKCSLDM